MPLPAVHADVTTPTGETIERAIVMATRKSRFIIQSRQGAQLVDVETTGVQPLDGGKSYSVETADGTYLVSRRRGCGCGR